MPSIVKAALLALLAASPAVAQRAEAGASGRATEAPRAEPDSALTARDSTATPRDSTAGPRLGALLRRAGADALAAQAQVVSVPPPAPPPAPTVHAFGSGLRVTVPAGWDGPASAYDGDPAYGLYTFENTAPDHPLRDTIVRLERVGGLNDLLRERWMRGQTPHGYHGTRPVGPSAAPVPGFGVEVEGVGVRGVTVFTQSRSGYWALQVVAPSDVWAQRRGDVLALLAGVALP